MTTWLVSRHAGARQWLAEQGIKADRVVEHLDAAAVARGDTVIGTLPVHLAAAVCGRGACFWFLAVDVPPTLRGKELSAEDLKRLGARLESYWVERRPCGGQTGDGAPRRD